MLNFNQWNAAHLNEQQTPSSNSSAQTNNRGPKKQWEDLINDHRVHFTNAFSESDLTEADRQFVIAFFKNFKYSTQKPAGHIFETKIRSVKFQVAFFKKQRWAACIITDNSREVTELFTVNEMKIQTLYTLFEKAIKQNSFKDILPVTTR